MSKENLTDDELNELIDDLGIKVENVYSVILNGEVEMIGELFDIQYVASTPDEFYYDEDVSINTFLEESQQLYEAKFDSYAFISPVRIYTEAWNDDDGNVMMGSCLVNWNERSDSVYTRINKASIISMDKPNKKTLNQYLTFIYNSHNKLIEDENLSFIITSLNKKNDNSKNNITNFTDYFMLREQGKF